MVIQHDNPLLSHDEIGILLSSAGLAPSMHNTQPWRFEVTGQVVDVLLDEDRTLPTEDHSGRLPRIGLGAARSTSGWPPRCSASRPRSRSTRTPTVPTSRSGSSSVPGNGRPSPRSATCMAKYAAATPTADR